MEASGTTQTVSIFGTPLAHHPSKDQGRQIGEAAKWLSMNGKIGAPDTIRTCDLCLRRITLGCFLGIAEDSPGLLNCCSNLHFYALMLAGCFRAIPEKAILW